VSKEIESQSLRILEAHDKVKNCATLHTGVLKPARVEVYPDAFDGGFHSLDRQVKARRRVPRQKVGFVMGAFRGKLRWIPDTENMRA
jgi:hypothetical protein